MNLKSDNTALSSFLYRLANVGNRMVLMETSDRLTDSAQTITATRDYQASGQTNDSSGTSWNRFWWVGRLGYCRQPDTSDYWVRARVMRPQIGRWVSRDPKRLGVNWSTYVSNSPLSAGDPSGEVFCKRMRRRVQKCKPGKYWGCPPDKPPEPPGSPSVVKPCRPSDPRERSCITARIAWIKERLAEQQETGLPPQEQPPPPGVRYVIWACTECSCEVVCENGKTTYYRVAEMYVYTMEQGFPTCACVQHCLLKHEEHHGKQCLNNPERPTTRLEAGAYERELKCLEDVLKGKH